MSSSLETVPPGERRAVLAGVVLGEDEGLEADLRDSFRASGLYHLLAVSGQNVAYVVAGTILVVWALGLPRWLGELGALGTVAAYVLAVGWQPSVVRAGIAGGLASLAWLASRPRDRWYFLLVGAAVLLAWNPYSLLEPGFQLSFSAVAAIFVLVPCISRRLEGYPLASATRRGDLALGRLRARDRARPLAPLRRRTPSTPFSRTRSPRPSSRRCWASRSRQPRSTRSCPRPLRPSCGSTRGSPATSRSAPGWSGAFRTRR